MLAADIIYRVKRANTALPYRPQLKQRDELNPSLVIIIILGNNLLIFSILKYHLIRDCWCESPADRPKMEMVRTLLRQMIPNRLARHFRDVILI
jgi:hypothetical protein